MKKIRNAELVHGNNETRIQITFEDGSKKGGKLKCSDQRADGRAAKASGKYTIAFDDGSSYSGNLAKNIISGQGTYRYQRGSEYSGEFENGEIHGKGKYTFSKESNYTGEFKNGKIHGEGKYTFRSGASYEGKFKNGKIDGIGAYSGANGRTFIGPWKNGTRIESGISLNGGNLALAQYGDGGVEKKSTRLGKLEMDASGNIIFAISESGDKIKLDAELAKFLGKFYKNHPKLLQKYIQSPPRAENGPKPSPATSSGKPVTVAGPTVTSRRTEDKKIAERQKDEERRKREEERRKREEEKRKKDDRRKEEERRRVENEKRAKEEERRKEEKRKREEERKRKEEESKKIERGTRDLTEKSDSGESQLRLLAKDQRTLAASLKKIDEELLKLATKIDGYALALNRQSSPGTKNGWKTKEYANAKYLGEQNGRKEENGLGIMSYDDGDEYVGEWKSGEKHGIGRFRGSKGWSYGGEWNGDKKHGIGISRGKEGWSYGGEWNGDKRQGIGRYIGEEGWSYEGGWKNNVRDGYGVYRDTNGIELRGSWKNSKKHGEFLCREKAGDIFLLVRREYYDDKIKMQWKHHLSEGLHGPGGQKIPLYSNEFAATGKKIVDGTESSEEKKTSAVIYHSYGSMSKNSLVPERSIRIDYELINRLLGENKINDFDDLVKLGAVVDVSEGVARLTSFADLRKYLALSNSLNFSERKIIKKDADLFDSGTVDEQYLIQLVATENVEELRRMRFQKIGLSSKKGGPSLSFGSLFSGKKEFNSYSDCYKNITSLLNSLSIDLDSTGEDYISVQLDTLQGNHAVTAIIDIKKLKSLRSRGVNLNKTKEKFIYIYDTSRIVDDTSSEHRGNDLDGLMKNSEMFSQNQQAGGSCWFNAAASALAAAQNPSIVRDMADGKIKPYPKNINRLTEAPNALEVKQALTLQHIAELSEISKKLSGGLVADHVVNSSFRQNVFGYAEKEKILRRIETRLDSYAVLNGKEKKELKRQLEEKFATGWASPGRTDARVTADKFQESLRKLDMENELFRKLDKSLEQKQAVHLSSRVAALAKNMNTLDLAEVILAVKTLDRSIGVRKNLRVV